MKRTIAILYVFAILRDTIGKINKTYLNVSNKEAQNHRTKDTWLGKNSATYRNLPTYVKIVQTLPIPTDTETIFVFLLLCFQIRSKK